MNRKRLQQRVRMDHALQRGREDRPGASILRLGAYGGAGQGDEEDSAVK